MASIIEQSMAKFLAALEKLTGAVTVAPEGCILGLAVSGGPDSLALLLLAHRAMPGKFRVATVDHGLRLEAADEARFVAAICNERGISHNILHPAEPISGNTQSAARGIRYALLDQWANDHALLWIATGHHADDQLETLLMRLARGSGVSGMAGIRAVNGRVIRPLLGFDKQELVSICALAGVAPCHDPSNDKPEYDRVRMRQWLQSAPEILRTDAASRSAGAIADANIALEWMAVQLEPAHVTILKSGGLEMKVTGLPREIIRRLLLRALSRLDASVRPRGETIDRALTELAEGKRLTIGDIMVSGGSKWVLEPAPARRIAR